MAHLSFLLVGFFDEAPPLLIFPFLAYFTSFRFFSIPILTGQGQITPQGLDPFGLIVI